MIEEQIQAAKQYVKTLFADRADGHDVEHTLRVYTNAMKIAQAEGPCDLEIVGLSALLHDADDDKLFHTENNANARMFLEEISIPQDQIDGHITERNRHRRRGFRYLYAYFFLNKLPISPKSQNTKTGFRTVTKLAICGVNLRDYV